MHKPTTKYSYVKTRHSLKSKIRAKYIVTQLFAVLFLVSGLILRFSGIETSGDIILPIISIVLMLAGMLLQFVALIFYAKISKHFHNTKRK